MKAKTTDIIPLSQAATLGELFRERVRRSGQATAYIQFDETSQRWQEYSWEETARDVARWQAALVRESLSPGDRVAIMLRNSRNWAIFDLAAQGLGLVSVPIYTNDRAENIGYILQDAGVRLLLFEGEAQWGDLRPIHDQLAGLRRLVSLESFHPKGLHPRLACVDEWLPQGGAELQTRKLDPHALASIVYTSGTTGRSKGVMLSHHNMIWNAHAALQIIDVFPEDRFLSFLPLSHTLERTVGYYLPILSGSSVAYARSIPQLGEDLLAVRPTILISVPRIFERVYGKIQTKLAEDPALTRILFHQAQTTGWKRFLYQQHRRPWSPTLLLWPLWDRLIASKVRAKLGGRLRFAVSGGAPLPKEVAELFVGLGVTIAQGYGLTETSPIVTGNPLNNNVPDSIGIPLPGVEIRIGPDDELLTRSPSVMLGYWNNEQATREAIDDDGWLHTGDKVRRDGEHLFITGRVKEIIVLANGEKVPPADMEMAITLDNLFEQVLVIGEGKPYLSALVVLNDDEYRKVAKQLGLAPGDQTSLQSPELRKLLLQRIADQLHSFPGYARLYAIRVVDRPWTVENGLLTPTMKLRRAKILKAFDAEVQALYAGH